VLLVAGVVDAGEAFSGFSNSAPLTVAALYVVAAAAGRTRVLVRRERDQDPRPAGDAGLASVQERHFGAVGSSIERRLDEAVIAPGSGLVGSTLRESGFRGRYGGAVIAVTGLPSGSRASWGRCACGRATSSWCSPGRRSARAALDRRDFLLVAPMAYGIGGYRFTGFARLGFPLVIVMVAVSLVMIPIAWPLR
jgi:hypothetical protein